MFKIYYNMLSSYNNNLNYGDLLCCITHLINPTNIVEFGILNGYSLDCFNKSTNCSSNIYAYDIFDEFNGNHANKNILLETFNNFKNIKIEYGDFYKKYKEIPKYTIDILHIDIANTGEIYEFVFENYINKISKNGIIILEGGSEERDNVSWMTKYNKKKIRPIINKYNKEYNIITIGIMPSITIIKLQ